MDFKRFWNYSVLFFSLICAIFIPLHLVFNFENDFKYFTIIFEIIVSILFIGDIIFRKYYFINQENNDLQIKSNKYLFIDIISALPIGLLLFSTPIQMFSLLRLFKLYRVSQQLQIWRKKKYVKIKLSEDGFIFRMDFVSGSFVNLWLDWTNRHNY